MDNPMTCAIATCDRVYVSPCGFILCHTHHNEFCYQDGRGSSQCLLGNAKEHQRIDTALGDLRVRETIPTVGIPRWEPDGK